jgi:DUF4097 and DUF4098 domain-containing protein YvlB
MGDEEIRKAGWLNGLINLKASPHFVLVLFFLASVAPFTLAQERHLTCDNGTEETSGTLSAARNLRVKVDVGSVIVRGGGQQGISYAVHAHCNSRRRDEEFKISAYVRGDTAWITGEWEGGRARDFSGEFRIDVPREINLVKIETEGGNVDTTGIAGRVEAESGGGSIHLDDIGAGAHAETGGGSIEVGTINGDIGLETGGGSIEVHHANGKLVAETGGGSVTIMSASQGASVETGGGGIQVHQCYGKIKVSTGGGSVDLGDIGGSAEIETGGGSIHLASAKGHVDARTGGGGIELFGVPSVRAETGAGGIVVKLVKTGAEPASSSLETSAGDITVYIEQDLAISVRASVDLGSGHHITSEFPDIHISSEGDKWGPKTLSAEGQLNGGGPVLKVRTTTGDICFRRTNQ